MSDLQPASRVILLDSSSVLKSCFEGYQATRTSSYNGRAIDVAGLYGYLYRTMKIYETFEFEALVHVLDPPGGSHYRYSLYPDYKAKRKPKDPLLAAQEALMASMLAAFGERLVCKRGVESDDVLATMAEKLANDGHEVLIISPDKDLMQLVSDGRISLARYVDNPGATGKTYAIYEEKEVLEAMGVRPDQLADFLALVGDNADNIPGVFRCGDKTAAKWLAEYGDLATLMTRAQEVGGKIGQCLRDTLDQLPLYQKLTNVLRDVEGVDLPPAPEPDDELHALMRDVLVLPDSFPSRFAVGGAHAAPTQAQTQAPAKKPRADGTPAASPKAPPVSTGSYRPAQAPAAVRNPDQLVAPLGDVLAGPPAGGDRPKLGMVFVSQQAPGGVDVDDPFADMGADPALLSIGQASPVAGAASDGNASQADSAADSGNNGHHGGGQERAAGTNPSLGRPARIMKR